VALATEYVVYVPLFALLFYVDNRHTSISIRTPAKGMIDRIWKKKGK
jgi:hypothetical protein